ncbi:MAG TPA: Yip1 family protein [Casimicrobiaceae bacterium]|nr:Yip1 family protein [Casimicrobiaceae bacterium]
MEPPPQFADRVKGILFAPRDEWRRIAAEPASIQSIYSGWIMLLAAIGPVAVLVSTHSLRLAVAEYILWLIITFLLAQVVDALAPTFGGSRDFVASLKLTAYSLTVAWLAGVFNLFGVLGFAPWLVAMAYAFYTLFLGASVLKKASPDRALPFTLVIVLCAFVLGYLASVIVGGMLGTPHSGSGMRAEAAWVEPVTRSSDEDVTCTPSSAGCLPRL